jgi:hypothetical protein
VGLHLEFLAYVLGSTTDKILIVRALQRPSRIEPCDLSPGTSRRIPDEPGYGGFASKLFRKPPVRVRLTMNRHVQRQHVVVKAAVSA